MRNIGLDVHKRKTQICVQDESGTTVRKARLDTDVQVLVEFLRPFAPAKVLLEASTVSEFVARGLERAQSGLQVFVGDPNYLPMYGTITRHTKTDERDAKALADAVRQGFFREVHRPDDKQIRRRRTLRVRRKLVGARSSLIALVRSLCLQEGVVLPSCPAESFRRTATQHGLHADLREDLAPIFDTLAMLEDAVPATDRRVEELQDDVTRRLQTVCGVGPLVALAFMAAIGNVARFANAHRVESYIGLVPREMSSGEKRIRGSITRVGDGECRAMLVQAAWMLVRSKDPQVARLREWFESLQAKKGAGKAIVALARRLAGILYAIARDGRPFDPSKLGGVRKTSERRYVLRKAAA